MKFTVIALLCLTGLCLAGADAPAPTKTWRQEIASAPKPLDYVVGTVDDGGTLSGIAQLFYEDASKWELIYHANRSVIKDPDVIRKGMKLTIPKAPVSNESTAGDTPRLKGLELIVNSILVASNATTFDITIENESDREVAVSRFSLHNALKGIRLLDITGRRWQIRPATEIIDPPTPAADLLTVEAHHVESLEAKIGPIERLIPPRIESPPIALPATVKYSDIGEVAIVVGGKDLNRNLNKGGSTRVVWLPAGRTNQPLTQASIAGTYTVRGHHWWAGEVIYLSEDHFYWTYFTDALPGPNPKARRYTLSGNHIVFDDPKIGHRIITQVGGTFLMWTTEDEEAYLKSGKTPMHVLYGTPFNADRLESKVGSYVGLVGEFNLHGKLGPYVQTPWGVVYLRPAASASAKFEFWNAQSVAIRGTLRFQRLIPAPKPLMSAVEAHYYIEASSETKAELLLPYGDHN